MKFKCTIDEMRVYITGIKKIFESEFNVKIDEFEPVNCFKFDDKLINIEIREDDKHPMGVAIYVTSTKDDRLNTAFIFTNTTERSERVCYVNIAEEVGVWWIFNKFDEFYYEWKKTLKSDK